MRFFEEQSQPKTAARALFRSRRRRRHDSSSPNSSVELMVRVVDQTKDGSNERLPERFFTISTRNPPWKSRVGCYTADARQGRLPDSINRSDSIDVTGVNELFGYMERCALATIAALHRCLCSAEKRRSLGFKGINFSIADDGGWRGRICLSIRGDTELRNAFFNIKKKEFTPTTDPAFMYASIAEFILNQLEFRSNRSSRFQ